MILDITHVVETGSTNDDLMSRARKGAPEGTVISAAKQSRGKGRQNKIWQSPTGNLSASILLKPTRPKAEFGQLSFVVGLALGEALGKYGINWNLKWPNDVMVGSAKIAGILLESEDDWVVAGTGANIAHTPVVRDKLCTSLHQLGCSNANKETVLETYLRRLEHWYEIWSAEGFSPIREAWLERAYNLGGLLTVNLSAELKHEGRFSGIDEDGALLLEKEENLQRILSGDVFFR